MMREVSSLSPRAERDTEGEGLRERRHQGRRTPQYTTNPGLRRPQKRTTPCKPTRAKGTHGVTTTIYKSSQGPSRPRTGWMHVISIDTRLGVATTLGSEVTAMCVQLVDASGNLAIHMPTRILLRSSSTHEPSDPPLEVVRRFWQASAPLRKQAGPTHPRGARPAPGAPPQAQRIKGLGFISLARSSGRPRHPPAP